MKKVPDLVRPGSGLLPSRFKARFISLYHNEYDDDAVRLCISEELLEEKIRNECGECITDRGMYPFVWERLDAVYASQEVMVSCRGIELNLRESQTQ